MMWTFGGLAAATGASLTAVGLAADKNGMVVGGVPALGVGAALLIWGFFLDEQVFVRGLPLF